MNSEWRVVDIHPRRAKEAQKNLRNVPNVELVLLPTDIGGADREIKKLLAQYAFTLGNWEIIEINRINNAPGVRNGLLIDISDIQLLNFIAQHLTKF